MHHVEHTIWQAGFVHQLCNQQRGTRITLRRLEDKAVAAGNRQWVHPQRHHGREVERGDTGDHAQRLKVGPGVDVRADVAAVFAFEDFWRSAGVFDVLDATLQFTGGVFQGLAMFFADELGNARLVLLKQLLEAEQDLGTLGRWGIAPCRECSLGRIDGQLHRGAAGQCHFMDGLAGRRVENISRAVTGANQVAIDQVLDSAHAKLLKGGWIKGESARPCYIKRDQSIWFRASPTASNRRSSSCGLLLKVGPNCRVSPPKRT
ncbi:hypothetical protein D3C84_558620 [compost metagenome]